MTDDLSQDIDGIIFDFDETLIDAPKGMEAALRAVIERLLEYFPSNKSDFEKDYLVKKLSDFDDRMNLEKEYERDSWWPKFVKEVGFGDGLDQSQTEELTRVYWEEYAESAVPYPSTVPVLEYLSERGYALGMITDTDGSGRSKRDRIFRFDFPDIFESIVVSGADVPEVKPNPEPFELAASQLGVEPSKCVMVGDKPFTDIKGANALGMKTILVDRRDWDVEEDSDFVIDSLDDLKDLF